MKLQRAALFTLLFVTARTLGWWARGINTAVHAQQHSASGAGRSSDVSFQFGGTGRDSSLTLYVPETHTFFVYPTNPGSSHINCEYMLHFDRPGAPMERQNCAVGPAY